MKFQISLIGILACLTFGCCIPKKTEPLPPADSSSGSPLLIVADPQIHNVFGMELKQMLGVSDVVSKVAIRPPELNILAPLILTHLVSEAQKTVTPKAIILLGDATNIACSGEYLRFAESLEAARPDGVPLFLAHGNHDSYLMGTANSYIPMDDLSDWPPVGMDKGEPVDVSWWGNSTKISSKHRRNWRDACFQSSDVSQEPSSPMNKSRWLAKYLSALKSDGLVKTPVSSILSKDLDEGVALDYTTESGSLLAKYTFQAAGIWFPPKFGAQPSSSDTKLTRVSKSFIVQSIDFDDSRVVIIDTSVCEVARGGIKFKSTNAGTHACIGDDQFKFIKRYVDNIPEGRRLVIAGHFPLKDLSEIERNRLITIASEHEDWVYLSAHSHTPVSETVWPGGWEINVGSTTDWPMEVNSVWLAADNKEPRVLKTRNLIPEGFRYSDPSRLMNSEVCRHLPSAKYLAEIRIEDDVKFYRSPIDASCAVENEFDWNTKGNELFGYIQVINDRFNTDAAYRNLILNIAGAASQSEDAKSDLLKFLP